MAKFRFRLTSHFLVRHTPNTTRAEAAAAETEIITVLLEVHEAAEGEGAGVASVRGAVVDPEGAGDIVPEGSFVNVGEGVA